MEKYNSMANLLFSSKSIITTRPRKTHINQKDAFVINSLIFVFIVFILIKDFVTNSNHVNPNSFINPK